MSWEAPPFEVSTRSLTTAEALSVRALLNLVGAKQQQERRAYHHERATAHAAAALEQDPENLIALQVALAEGRHPPIAALKNAAARHPKSWVAWLTLVDTLGKDDRARADRDEALNRAAAIAPDEGEVLIRLGYQALSRGQWQKAMNTFLRVLAIEPDQPAVARGYLLAVSHHQRCGAEAAASAARLEGASLSPAEWATLIRVTEVCVSSADGASSSPPEVDPRPVSR
jgi:tetratricopeptide (TPR) repeat protein